LQEVVVSPKVDVYCGGSKISIKTLHAALLYIVYMQVYITKELFDRLNAALDADMETRGAEPSYDPELLRQFERMRSVSIPESAHLVFGMRQGYQSSAKIRLDLIQLLAKVRVGRKATDLRDKIFGLLGMARDALGISPNCDEKNSCIRVYCETARAIIASGAVDFLSFSQPIKCEDERPSWVPDWRQEVIEPCGLLPWDTPYIALGNKDTGKFEKHPDFDSAPLEHLLLSGYRIDSIESLKDRCNEGKYLKMVDREAAAKYINDIWMLCNASNEKLNQAGKEIYSSAFARILAPTIIPVAGMFLKGFVRTATIEECKLGWEEVNKDYVAWKNGSPLPEKPITMISYYNMMARQVSRQPFITKNGFVGLAPGHAQTGDVVVILRGGKFPYTLRKNDDETYKLIGETYLHGVMYGEFVKADMKAEEFRLG
jgi:hypothetical protein